MKHASASLLTKSVSARLSLLSLCMPLVIVSVPSPKLKIGGGSLYPNGIFKTEIKAKFIRKTLDHI